MINQRVFCTIEYQQFHIDSSSSVDISKTITSCKYEELNSKKITQLL